MAEDIIPSVFFFLRDVRFAIDLPPKLVLIHHTERPSAELGQAMGTVAQSSAR